MTVQIQQEAMQVITDIISFLIPLALIIVVSLVLVNFFKRFLRGE